VLGHHLDMKGAGDSTKGRSLIGFKF